MADVPAFAGAGDCLRWLQDQRNDLQAPAIALQPSIDEVLKQMSWLPGQWLVRMSGSGATCFALFETAGQAEMGAKALRADNPDWWIKRCALT